MLTRLLNKLRHPGAHIAPHAQLSDTTLGPHTVIHPHARLGNCTLGPSCVIHPHAELYNTTLEAHNTIHPRVQLTDCTIGAHTYIARETFLNDIRIGRFSSIGPRVLAGTGEHPSNLLVTSPKLYSPLPAFRERAPVTIGNDVWIGAHAFLRDGVTIADGAIIAAGAVVTRDIPPYHIYGGVPAKLIRPRFDADIIARLVALAWWNWPEDRLRAARPCLVSSDPAALLSWAGQSAPPIPQSQIS